MKIIKKPKGTDDVLPSSIDKWYYVEEQFKKLCNEFGYHEIRTPMFEFTDLFRRGVGETTDVVQKEMFNLEQRVGEGGKTTEALTLKPEVTAPVVRAFIENSLYGNAQPTKVFYNSPCFRYEKPQKGRMREFHQFGIEVLSSKAPYTDAEVIALVATFFERLGIAEHIKLQINSVGTPESRKNYSDALKKFFEPNLNELCEDCKERFEKNPMRLLDCKVTSCKAIGKGAPLIIDYLDEDSKMHFESLQEYLDIMGIAYEIDPYIVRGLDYYVKTAFEFVTDKLGSQATVCGGGRYDGLVEQLGGPSTAGIGFGMGIERLLLLMDTVGAEFPPSDAMNLFIVALDEQAKKKAVEIIHMLRKKGISCEVDHLDRSMKAQMKYADKIGVKYTAIIGESEIQNNCLILKNMTTSQQQEITLNNFADEFVNIIGKGAQHG
ncbi:MAG: histidine--tRNA ligase [Peptostreptococcaceae bacterium]|nr:histidine--tRNA ligase [Peptostreptococcaceae bacterium]